MQDRVPVNPGRVLITPENGSAAYYATMTRADNPTQEGTPLNKASLLKDTTATLFGLGAAAVPDDVFAVLSRFQSGLGNEYLWEKGEPAYEYSFSGGSVTNHVVGTFKTKSSILYADTKEDAAAGIGKTLSSSNYSSGANFANAVSAIGSGKWLSFSYEPGVVVQTDFTVSTAWYNSSSDSIYVPGAKYSYGVIERFTTLGYVNSSDPNAYPIDDGYTYTALGQLGNKVQIATGSYKGTGTYKASGAISLTFDSVPKLVVIHGVGQSGGVGFVIPAGLTSTYQDCGMLVLMGSDGSKCDAKLTGKTLSWYYNASDANKQLNASGDTYNWIAFY